MNRMQLLNAQGERLYLNKAERIAFLAAARHAPREVRTLCLTLHYTGCRISEALSLTPQSFDLAEQVVIVETLKKRKAGVYRAIPMPLEIFDALDLVHGLRVSGKRGAAPTARLWSWSRPQAWRHIKAVMREAEISGARATSKGLRHGFGVAAIVAGVPLNKLRDWMGHASVETTAIYANALGEEERALAAKMWE